jgi:hypothetical protein
MIWAAVLLAAAAPNAGQMSRCEFIGFWAERSVQLRYTGAPLSEVVNIAERHLAAKAETFREIAIEAYLLEYFDDPETRTHQARAHRTLWEVRCYDHLAKEQKQ